jgi:hypothetical protein
MTEKTDVSPSKFVFALLEFMLLFSVDVVFQPTSLNLNNPANKY